MPGLTRELAGVVRASRPQKGEIMILTLKRGRFFIIFGIAAALITISGLLGGLGATNSANTPQQVCSYQISATVFGCIGAVIFLLCVYMMFKNL